MVVILKPGAIIRLPATTKKLLFPPLSLCFQSHLFFEKRLDWELTGSSINSFHSHLVLKCLKLEQLFVHIFFRKILLDCLRFPLPCFILLAEVIPKTMRQIFSLIPFFIKAFATLLDSTFDLFLAVSLRWGEWWGERRGELTLVVATFVDNFFEQPAHQ